NGSNDIRLSIEYPTALSDLFKRDQVIVAGRYSGAGKAVLKLTGTVNGRPFNVEDQSGKKFSGTIKGQTKSCTEKIEFPEKESDNDFIPRLWATRRVGALLDQIRL